MPPEYPADGPVLRVGFVGTGGVATRHATILAGFPDVLLAAATDVDPARNAAFAAEFGTEVTDGVADLLAHDLDAVYVCVPPFAHVPADASAEAQVAAAGLPLFVEKPLAPDLATAEEIAMRLDDAGVVTRVGHHWRCAEPVARARALLEGRPIRLVTATWWDKVPPVSWWPHRDLSGGPVVEQAIHVLDLARVLAGEVVEVSARAGGSVPGGDVDAVTTALLSFANGAVGTLSAASVLGAKHRAGLEIVADGLVVGVGEDWLEVRDGSAEPVRTEFDRWTACVAADRAFVDAVGGGLTEAITSPPDYAEALRSHRLATAVVRSAASGAPERLG